MNAYRFFVRSRSAEGAGPATIDQDMSYIHTVLTTGDALTDANTDAALTAYRAAHRTTASVGAVARPQERDRRPTDAEILKLRGHWAKRRRAAPMWSLTLFACPTALRLSEMCGTRWTDLDEGARTVIVRDRKHPRNKKGNDQTVPLPCGPGSIGGDMTDPLEIIQVQRRTDAAIFPFSPATVSTSFTRAVAGCEIEDLRFHDLHHDVHDLHHDACSRLFEAGYGIEQVSLNQRPQGLEHVASLHADRSREPVSRHRLNYSCPQPQQ